MFRGRERSATAPIGVPSSPPPSSISGSISASHTSLPKVSSAPKSAGVSKGSPTSKDKHPPKGKDSPVKIPKKMSSLDEAYPTFQSFLDDPMALSYFKAFLYAKVCMENIIFYELVTHFQKVELEQSASENAKLTKQIFQDFIPDKGSTSTYVLNIDSSCQREIQATVRATTQVHCTAAIFKNILKLVVNQMQTEWFAFKKSEQGITLLRNLNAGFTIILPNPEERKPVALPSSFSAHDNPLNW